MDAPQAAVTGAQTLVSAVMEDRGYPTQPYDQTLADLSVEHASTLDHFRAAHDISQNAAAGTASTEDLRQAMIHYRALFDELLGEPDARPDGRAGAEGVATTQPDGLPAADQARADQVPADEAPVSEPARERARGRARRCDSGGRACGERVGRGRAFGESGGRPGRPGQRGHGRRELRSDLRRANPRRGDRRAAAGEVTQMTSQRDETTPRPAGEGVADDPIIIERHDEILTGDEALAADGQLWSPRPVMSWSAGPRRRIRAAWIPRPWSSPRSRPRPPAMAPPRRAAPDSAPADGTGTAGTGAAEHGRSGALRAGVR